MRRLYEHENTLEESNSIISGCVKERMPLGFRFRPTEEELLNFYLRQKVKRSSSHKFAFDHIVPEVDLNRLEPWDIREKCKVDITNQSDRYFFCHKGKKYPTGMRTNRATKSGFWKATGRDKPIYSMLHKGHKMSSPQQIGMRKTLVFYKGRAPHGTKTNWIMHEYRLLQFDHGNTSTSHSSQEHDEWVICHIFTKINDDGGSDFQANSTSLVEDTSHSEIDAHRKLMANNAFPCNQDHIDVLPQLESPKFQTNATVNSMHDDGDSSSTNEHIWPQPTKTKFNGFHPSLQTKEYVQNQVKNICMDEEDLSHYLATCHDAEANQIIDNKFFIFSNMTIARIQQQINSYPFNCEIELWNY